MVSPPRQPIRTLLLSLRRHKIKIPRPHKKLKALSQRNSNRRKSGVLIVWRQIFLKEMVPLAALMINSYLLSMRFAQASKLKSLWVLSYRNASTLATFSSERFIHLWKKWIRMKPQRLLLLATWQTFAILMRQYYQKGQTLSKRSKILRIQLNSRLLAWALWLRIQSWIAGLTQSTRLALSRRKRFATYTRSCLNLLGASRDPLLLNIFPLAISRVWTFSWTLTLNRI